MELKESWQEYKDFPSYETEKSKRIFPILIAAIIVLSIIFYAGYNSYQSKNEDINESSKYKKINLPPGESKDSSPKQEKTESSEQESKDAAATQQALDKSDDESCSEISSDSPFVSKDSCYNYLAMKTSEISLCDKIVQEEIKENCYENAY